VVEFAALPDGGFDPYPAVVIVDDGSGLLGVPNGLGFDSSGDLWVAGNASTTAVIHLHVAGLDGITPMAPVAVIEGIDPGTGNSTTDSPDYVTFDQSGALWLYNQNVSTFVRWTDPSSFSGVVTPTPDRVIDVSLGGDTGKFA